MELGMLFGQQIAALEAKLQNTENMISSMSASKGAMSSARGNSDVSYEILSSSCYVFMLT